MDTKFLFFASGDGMDAAGDSAIYPLSSFRGMFVRSATALQMHFDPVKLTDVAAGDDVDFITITFASGNYLTVATAIIDFINTSDPGIVKICDADNSVFCSNLITDCSITLAS
tara:strand:- start:3583 stop:3921 length:339 start_codon:yes stop_codon:yes gene_type:complete